MIYQYCTWTHNHAGGSETRIPRLYDGQFNRFVLYMDFKVNITSEYKP